MIALTEPVETSIVLMGQDEARRAVETIKTHLDSARRLLLDLHEREGWRALGYASWQACATAEFGQSSAHVYRLLTAAQIERSLDSPIGESRESHLRPLAKLKSSDQQKDALKRADQLAGSKPRTAAHVAQAVEEIDLPPEFAVVQRRLAAHGIVLLSNMQGHERMFVTRKEGGTTGIATPTWSNVTDRLDALEHASAPVADDDPAIEMEIKRLCAICGARYLGIPSDLPYPTATRYRIAFPNHGGGGDYLADEALAKLHYACDARAAAVQAPAASDRVAHLAEEESDSKWLDMAEMEIAGGNVHYARQLLGRVSDHSAYRRDQLLARLPAETETRMILLPPFPASELPALMDSINAVLEMSAKWPQANREKAEKALGLLRAVGRKAQEMSE